MNIYLQLAYTAGTALYVCLISTTIIYRFCNLGRKTFLFREFHFTRSDLLNKPFTSRNEDIVILQAHVVIVVALIAFSVHSLVPILLVPSTVLCGIYSLVSHGCKLYSKVMFLKVALENIGMYSSRR